MRIKALTRYLFSMLKPGVIIFALIYLAITLVTAGLNMIVTDSVVMGVSGEVGGEFESWTSSIISFAVFSFVIFLICSQKDTKFLISRSVSRKEIFAAYAVFMCPFAAIMSALQIANIYIDSFIRWCMGGAWRGIALDFQTFQAPDMNNVLVFFAVSFSILFVFGAVGYLLGSLIGRWKIPTVIALSAIPVLFIALVGTTDLLQWIVDAFNFMYIDATSGLFVALKQIILAMLLLAISFPIMRRITAAKK